MGSLLNTPSALLPLQDVEDRHDALHSDDHSENDSTPTENSNPNSPLTPSASVRIHFADKKKAKKGDEGGKLAKKKIMQTTALIVSMETMAKELAEQVPRTTV